MIKNKKNLLQHKQQACPKGLKTKLIQKIREEAEQRLGTTNKEIDGRLCNLRASQELDKQVQQKLGEIDVSMVRYDRLISQHQIKDYDVGLTAEQLNLGYR